MHLRYDKDVDLLKLRKIFLMGDIDEENISYVLRDLALLNDSTEDVYLYICSDGGYIYDGLALIDMMGMVKYDINTIVTGKCCSMAAMIAICGTPNKRFITPNGKLMFHEGKIELSGTVRELKNDIAEFEQLEKICHKIVGERLGIRPSKHKKDVFARDLWLNAKDAIEYGAVDKIWTPEMEAKSSTVKNGSKSSSSRTRGKKTNNGKR